MWRRRGLAKFMAMTVAFALIVCSAAKAEEFTVNAERRAEAIANMANRSGGSPSPVTPGMVLSELRNTGDERLLNSTGGDLYANMLGTSISGQREFRRTLPSIFNYSQTAHYQNRADAGSVVSADGALASFAPENYYTYCPATMCAPGSKWVMWDVPFFTKETHKSEDNRLGYEQRVGGFSTGVSRMIGEASAIGLAVGYDDRRLKARDDYGMENKGNTLHLALFGGTNIGCFFIDGYAGFSRTWNKTKRRTDWNSADRSVPDAYGEARPHDNVYSAGLKGSYVWILGNDMRITPSMGVDFSHVRSSGSTEKGIDGTPFDSTSLLAIGKSNFTSVAVPMMVSINKTYSSSFLGFKGFNSLWTPEVRGGYVQQFGSKYATTDIATTNREPASSYSFTAESTRFNRSYGSVGAGVKVKLADKFIFNIDYDYSFASKWNHHSLTAMYGVSF